MANYTRTGLTIANGISPTGVLTFELQAFRTFSGIAGCNNEVNRINNNSWTVTVNYTILPTCSSTPAPGNTLSSASELCTGSQVTLNIQNVPAESGISFQWQTSPDNNTWTNAGPNAPSWTTTLIASTWYRCQVTCNEPGGGTGTSTPVQVLETPLINCLNLTTQGEIGYTGGNGLTGNTLVTFAITNNSGGPILLTDIENFWQTTNNNTNVVLWVSSTSLSGPTGPVEPPTWTSIATNGPIAIPANGFYPTFTAVNYVIPNGTSLRFAIQSSNGIRYSGGVAPEPVVNTFTFGGVSLLNGSAQLAGQNVGYGGTFPNGTITPRFFTGGISWQPLNCTAPTATATFVENCGLGQFTVNVDLTSLGDATSVDIVPSVGSPITGITTTGQYGVGPFASGQVSVTVVHNDDALCNLNLGTFRDCCPTTFTINNTLPTGNGNFASFTDAITFLNGGAACGPLAYTFNVAAGQTFAENPPALTRTGTASAPIIFQKDGAGANPVITPTGTASANEAGFAIHGADYITVDGVDIAGLGNQMEYGYFIRNLNATDGAKHNTIRNCAVTLDRSNASSIGILVSSVTTGGGFTPSNADGANSFNLIEGCTVTNSRNGILVTSSTTLALLGEGNRVKDCVVGADYGTGLPTGDIGLPTGTGAFYGIQFNGQRDGRIDGNIVRNVASTTGINRGIYTLSCAGTLNVNNNHVYGIRNLGTASSTQVRGIDISMLTGAWTARVYNNYVSDITAAYTGGATATRVLQGIVISTGGGTNVYEVDFNSVSIDGSGSITASSICLDYATTTGINRTRGNILANFTGAQTGVAKHWCMRAPLASSLGAAGSVSDHNNLFIANSANGFVGLTGTTDRIDLAAWTAAISSQPGTDANSLSTNPAFADNRFDLAASATPLAGAGTPAGLPWVTLDYAGNFRPIPPSIGAWELLPLPPCAGVPSAGTINGDAFLCGAGSETTLTFAGAIGPGLSYQWGVSSTPGGPYTDLGTETVQLTGALSATSYYVVTTTCANSGQSNTSPEFTVEIRPVPTALAGAANGGIGCFGGSLDLTGSSDIGTDFAWTGPAGFSADVANPTIVPVLLSSAGTYTLVVTANGCSNEATVTVSVPQPITLAPTADPNPSCDGTSQLFANATLPSAANEYLFTTGTGAALDPMSGAIQLIGTGIDDTPSALTPIGFPSCSMAWSTPSSRDARWLPEVGSTGHHLAVHQLRGEHDEHTEGVSLLG